MKRMIAKFAAALCLVMMVAAPAHAVLPDEQLEDPALEARARELSKELRCVVCQNQSIDDSNAPLARDLRLLVRERITAGDTDEAVKAYIVSRYGDFVLLRPPVQPNTYFLWLGPAGFILLALAGFGLYMRKSQTLAPPEPLTDDERRVIAGLNNEPGTEE